VRLTSRPDNPRESKCSAFTRYAIRHLRRGFRLPGRNDSQSAVIFVAIVHFNLQLTPPSMKIYRLRHQQRLNCLCEWLNSLTPEANEAISTPRQSITYRIKLASLRSQHRRDACATRLMFFTPIFVTIFHFNLQLTPPSMKMVLVAAKDC